MEHQQLSEGNRIAKILAHAEEALSEENKNVFVTHVSGAPLMLSPETETEKSINVILQDMDTALRASIEEAQKKLEELFKKL